ncbi:CpaD family pilus assembly protein [Fulvimarina sp. 2208YS6-2-32]|uniref:CpaD family pilus assembly protein n=1 Tax=Fulvimarina uroteuthidis TaxID=3098149 RepID=A0ABU5HZ97_9HYPH|nr:CpaD family pilus assembly protein [Fulvimarina sp. 2208YS6-2-32]MDY8108452.1 CpaD family pilus assembly protein [Fulvimarina sp. 2208YS6-2-32]
MRFLFARVPIAASLLALSAALGACANVHHIDVGSVPDDYRTRHPIVVGEAEQALDIPILSGERQLAMPDSGRIEDFAKRFRHSGAETMRVMVPYGSPNAASAASISHEAIAVLTRSGVPRERVFVESYAAHDALRPTPIRLTFSTLTAQTAPCGRWPEDLGSTSENKNYQNFGCATQQNLAAQIADPRDLLSPRGLGPVDGERRDQVIEKYRKGQTFTSQRPEMESEYQW